MTAEEFAAATKRAQSFLTDPQFIEADRNLARCFQAQAQRIAELEAHLAARGPTREAIYTAIEEYCYVARDPKDDLSYIVAGKYQAADAILSLPASGALATAQAVTPRFSIAPEAANARTCAKCGRSINWIRRDGECKRTDYETPCPTIVRHNGASTP